MSLPRAAAIYARISSDPGETRAGVERQVGDCRRVADDLGWIVAGEYVDNDLSAFSGKRRPEYERMMGDLEDGLIDGIVVYNIDRLTRRPAELEAFVDALDRAGVREVQFVTGDTRLASDDGLMMARVQGAFAAKESANIGRRVRRKMEQVAAEGRPHGGSRRPFGYAADMTTLVPAEAEVVRTLAARFLAGESTNSLATWLNSTGVPTVTGSRWLTSTIRGMLTNPRYAGLRAHRGIVVGPAVWEAIITEDEHRRILAAYAQKKNSNRRTPQRYLLSGMVRCGKCDTVMVSAARVERGKATRRYACSSSPDKGGCGGTTITAAPLEQLVADATLYRLDSPELAAVLAGKASADEQTQTLSAEVDATNEQLEELSLAYANRDITMREWMTAKKPITQRLEAAQRRLATMTHTGSLAGIVGNGDQLRTAWEGLNLSRQHAIVAALVDRVVIGPGTPGARGVDPSRVRVVWRY